MTQIHCGKAAGLYIHVPFCIHKCPYCDFYSITDTTLETVYLKALQQEMRQRSGSSMVFDTIYIGGGTPSVLQTATLDAILEQVHRRFAMLPKTEITIEINPGTVDAAKLHDYRRIGINRINVGVQSFQENSLKFLGRIHSAADAFHVLQAVRRAGFDNTGFDLMYGLPGQTARAWHRELETAVSLRPEHLSCYMLTYESGTPMDRLRQKGEIKPMADDKVSRLFEMTMQFLEDQDYQQYEISNFAADASRQSRHNRKYWDFTSYIGLGPSAHSFTTPERSWNYANLQQYVKAVTSGGSSEAGREQLSREQQMIEWIYLGLRTTKGIDIQGFNNYFETDFIQMFDGVIENLTVQKYIRLSRDYCALTRRGRLLLDSVAGIFIQAAE